MSPNDQPCTPAGPPYAMGGRPFLWDAANDWQKLDLLLSEILLYTLSMREWAGNFHVREQWGNPAQPPRPELVGEIEDLKALWKPWAERMSTWACNFDRSLPSTAETHVRPPNPPY